MEYGAEFEAETAEASFLASLGEPVSGSTKAVPARPDLSLADMSKKPSLAELRNAIVPVTLAGEQRLPVDQTLEPWLPLGIQRGSTVQVVGSGSTSLVMLLVAQAMKQGSWMAAVGQSSVGWLAAEQQGVPLHQVVAVNDPPKGSWGQVMAAIVDAFDLLLVAPQGVGVRDARRIEARARERGSVVLCLGQGWPRAADLQVQVEWQRFAGLGWGHGHVSACWAQLTMQGRGGQGYWTDELLLAGTKPLETAEGVDHLVYAGSDAELLEPDVTVVPFRDVG